MFTFEAKSIIMVLVGQCMVLFILLPEGSELSLMEFVKIGLQYYQGFHKALSWRDP